MTTTTENSMKTKDPVCGMTVSSTSGDKYQYDGELYFFCSSGCCSKFKADPRQFLHKKETPDASPPSPGANRYICPMHPEVSQEQPGTCSICGMALEPQIAAADEQEDRELIVMRRRFWI